MGKIRRITFAQKQVKGKIIRIITLYDATRQDVTVKYQTVQKLSLTRPRE